MMRLDPCQYLVDNALRHIEVVKNELEGANILPEIRDDLTDVLCALDKIKKKLVDAQM